jgi:hypothetical protein
MTRLRGPGEPFGWKVRAACWIGLVLVAFAVGVLFLQNPQLGDDFTYWSFAFDLHERGLAAWQRHSFHDLRWPVWGVCWVLQGVLGYGPVSYYGVPLLYLAAGAGLSFTFARRLTGSLRVGWAGAIAFLFHPLLDSVCYRPMPDLGEGVWGAVAVLCWWHMVQSASRGRAALWAVLLGAAIFIAESNRLTGVFIIPVVVLCTLFFARRQFGWLLLAGATAAVLYAGEALFYHHRFDDLLHSVHANLGAKGKKGTESIALLGMPFRFLDTLVDNRALSILYTIAGLPGIVWAWRWGYPRDLSAGASAAAPPRPLGRVIVLWLVVLYLAYACAPQSLWPWRPLLRDADRFLAALAIPLSVLAAAGLAWLLQILPIRERRWGRWIFEHPILTAVAATVAMTAMSGRTLYDLGFIPEMRAYLRALPAGSKIFTHEAMRQLAFLVDGRAAARLTWLHKSEITNASPELEAMAASADEFWYARKLVWLNTRKKLERQAITKQEPLPTYFDRPEEQWVLARLLAKGDTPDLIFFRRRTPGMPAPKVLPPDAPEWGGLIPALPFEWRPSPGGDRPEPITWPVPASLRGQLVRLEIEAAAPQVQPFFVIVGLSSGRRELAEYMVKPYLYPEGGKESFIIPLPAEADVCTLQFKFAKDAKPIRFLGLRGIFQTPVE